MLRTTTVSLIKWTKKEPCKTVTCLAQKHESAFMYMKRLFSIYRPSCCNKYFEDHHQSNEILVDRVKAPTHRQSDFYQSELSKDFASLWSHSCKQNGVKLRAKKSNANKRNLR